MKSKNINKDCYKMELKTPEEFYEYYKVYYGYAHNNLYFRKSNDYLLDKAKYIDSCYFIYVNDLLAGGVLISSNKMTDLFMIPPYEDYNILLNAALEKLIEVSDKTKPIHILEVPESLEKFYYNSKFDIKFNESWKFMIAPTKEVIKKLPNGYVESSVENFDKHVLGELLSFSYRQNEFHDEYYTTEELSENIKLQLSYKDTKKVIYDSSLVLKDIDTNKPIAMILVMEDEGLPFITDIVVDVNHKRKGLASYLMFHSISSLYGKYPSIRLSVSVDNGAFELYKKCGFIYNDSLINYKVIL